MTGLIVSLLVAAGGPWSLSDCIGYALEHNISIKQSTIDVEQKSVELNTAKNRILPQVSGNVSQDFSFGRGLTEYNIYENANTTNTGFSLSASMPLFQGLDIKNDVTMKKLQLAAVTSDLERAKNDIRTSVAAAFVQILYNKEILQVAQSQVNLDSTLVERIDAMKNAGKASEAELAAQKATYAQSKLSAVQADNKLRLSILDLVQLLEIDSPEGFDVLCPPTESLGLKLIVNPEMIYEDALTIKPEIRADSLRVDFSKTGIKKAKGGYMPSLYLSGGIGTNYYTNSTRASDSFGAQMRNNFSQSVGLTLSVPIFNRMAVRNNVRSAELTLHDQQLKLQSTKKELFKEIQQAYYNAVASGSKLLSSEEAEKSANISFNLTTEKYQNGKANVTEYNESKKRWLESVSNFLQARYEYLYLTSLLEFYRGGELTF